MQAFVIAAPIPDSDPTKANNWHPNAPDANPRLNELYMKTGALAIIKKSHIAKFTTKTLDG